VRQNFRLPRKFWKVVLVMQKRKLHAAAFLLDQEALLNNKSPQRLEPAEFRCRVADIEALTRLDFGDAVRGAAPIPD
jgi:DNA/RNA endonuclease G (NUC1)